MRTESCIILVLFCLSAFAVKKVRKSKVDVVSIELTVAGCCFSSLTYLVPVVLSNQPKVVVVTKDHNCN